MATTKQGQGSSNDQPTAGTSTAGTSTPVASTAEGSSPAGTGGGITAGVQAGTTSSPAGTPGTSSRKYKLADIQQASRRNKYNYQTAAGRRRINTMLHPILKKALQQLAEAHGQTVPDVLEGILCEYLEIDLSQRSK
jgi:hypothetical protein